MINVTFKKILKSFGNEILVEVWDFKLFKFCNKILLKVNYLFFLYLFIMNHISKE